MSETERRSRKTRIASCRLLQVRGPVRANDLSPSNDVYVRHRPLNLRRLWLRCTWASHWQLSVLIPGHRSTLGVGWQPTGWPKKMASFCVCLKLKISSSNINRFSKLFHCQNQEKICNNTITRDPTTPQVCRYTTLWNAFHWSRYWSVASPAWVRLPAARWTHWTFDVKTADVTVGLLFYTITETINTLFPVVNFLKCVVTEVFLFSIVAFKSLSFHKVV